MYVLLLEKKLNEVCIIFFSININNEYNKIRKANEIKIFIKILFSISKLIIFKNFSKCERLSRFTKLVMKGIIKIIIPSSINGCMKEKKAILLS